MRKEDVMRTVVLLVIILFLAANINGINSFLSFKTDKTVEFGHSIAVVPQAWNTTDEMNLANESKTTNAITNGYVYIDHWDDWPEDHITSISEAKFKAMEDGGYKVLKNSNSTLSGVKVSKQYFINPSRDTDKIWTPIGVNYVFPKEDTNYCIQVHYFTHQDYNNSTFLKELDERVEDDMSNINNKEYNGFYSGMRDIFNFFYTGITDHIEIK